MLMRTPPLPRFPGKVDWPGAALFGAGLLALSLALSTPGSVSDFGRLNGEINNAILRFRQAGVDHVLMIENAGIMPWRKNRMFRGS